jgi:putative SOS response-associated peptidase YedK
MPFRVGKWFFENLIHSASVPAIVGFEAYRVTPVICRGSDKISIESCANLTTAANELVKPYHEVAVE